jgi:hypothetical protein
MTEPTYAEQLRHAMATARVNERDLAHAAHVESHVVKGWLTGRAEPTPEQRAIIEPMLGLRSA